MTQHEAGAELLRMKSYRPFAEWVAIEESAGQWAFFDSLRKAKSYMRKAGISRANVIAAQESTSRKLS